ncbi:hypothetical protein BSKO_02500 [Bryopsis sp. KO-2023]|nr:hypothetical protein BSKO_02500 [Bryopsis sp. KO-2023]
MAESKIIKLKSSDDECFEVPEAVALRSETIKNMIEDIQGVEGYIVPLPDVNSTTLRKVIEYCQYHVDAEEKDQNGNPKKGEEEVRNWDQVYIQAASNLKITSLQDLCCQRIADMNRGRTKQEIRAMFNITNLLFDAKV